MLATSVTAFETLRLRAEADGAARSDPHKQQRRPSWAPPLVIAGELLEVCIKLELLAPEDKSIARLWAQFADPKRVGRVLREGNADKGHAMPSISCRGFELYAGNTRGNRGDALLTAQRYEPSYETRFSWRAGPSWRQPCHDPLRKVSRAQQEIARSQARVNLCTEPAFEGLDFEGKQQLLAYTQMDEAAYQRFRLEQATKDLEAKQRLLAEAQAADETEHQRRTERYNLRRRATELAAIRVAEFAGDLDMQMRLAGRLSGHCCCCGRELTDPKSLEIGIGPECIQHAAWVTPQGTLVRMLDAIADGRIAAVAGELRWVAT